MTKKNPYVTSWIDSVVAKLEPSEVVWVSGSESEYRSLCSKLVEEGVFTPLNPDKFPNSYWAISDPTDVARVEERTFICSRLKEDAGPTNYWCAPDEMYAKLDTLMQGCMRGRTMFVVPYLMGPNSSPYARVGFELTDSPYVVANMRIMARIGDVALKNLPNDSDKFVRGVHSTGTIDPSNRYIAHFPEDNTIVSFNSNYGGNALQGKKCFALRIASTLARNEGWLAEHMLIVGITNPKGETSYVCGAFPSACGKTNLAMLIPPDSYIKAGWKVRTVGDDIAWLNFGPDGRLYAINPEAGFFGVAPGTSHKTNANAMETMKSNTIFTNTALDLDTMTPWWEGLGSPPSRLKDWNGNLWSPDSGKKAAHPNSRFTAPASQCPSIDPNWEAPQGVPIDAIIFGGRRARTAPLVFEATNWQHGVFVGATMASERTAAQAGKVGELRRDPMAMKPFIGYHVGDYFSHWLNVGKRSGAKLPKIFHVNWFRADSGGNFIWPGFGENMRVLEWIMERSRGRGNGAATPLGFQPTAKDINHEGLSVSHETMRELLEVNPADWSDEIKSQHEFFTEVGNKLPKELWDEHNALKKRLGM